MESQSTLAVRPYAIKAQSLVIQRILESDMGPTGHS